MFYTEELQLMCFSLKGTFVDEGTSQYVKVQVDDGFAKIEKEANKWMVTYPYKEPMSTTLTFKLNGDLLKYIQMLQGKEDPDETF